LKISVKIFYNNGLLGQRIIKDDDDDDSETDKRRHVENQTVV
jgi:hypothetical protein